MNQPLRLLRRLSSTSVATLLLLLALSTSLSDRVVAQEDTAGQAVREAFRSVPEPPWYDAKQDQIRRIDVVPPKDVTARRSRWQTKPVNWQFPDWLGKLGEAIGWLLLIAVVSGLIYALAKIFGVVEWFIPSAHRNDELELGGDIDRVEALPFQLKRPQSDLLSEARRHYDAGEYDQAMIYFYSYQLVQLDRHQLIRLTKGKTNRQYLREARSHQVIHSILGGSMIRFEEVFFGHHHLTKARFETCWHRLEEFQRELEPVAV